MELGQTLKVILQHGGKDPKHMTLKWNSVEYPIEKGKPAYVPVEACIRHFGDPRSTAMVQALGAADGRTVIFVPDRAAEVRRVRFLYGAPLGGDETTFDGVPVPKVKVYTLDDEELPVVLNDPSGKSVIPITQTQTDAERFMAIVEAQQEQINELKGMLAASGGEAVVLQPTATSDSELPVDTGVSDKQQDGTLEREREGVVQLSEI